MTEVVVAPARPLVWVGSSKDDLKTFPREVMRTVGVALWAAQTGSKSPAAKPLKGDAAFKGAGVLEIVEDFSTDTYRVVYTVRFAEFVYVLHAFQKKSKSGISTPKKEIDKIKSRLKMAREHHAKHHAEETTS